MMNMPIIRFELEGIKHSLMVALSEYSLRMDEQLKESLERYFEPDNIRRVIEQEVWRTLDATIKEEVKNFLRYGGEGRKVIAAAVKEKLLNNKTYTLLDDTEDKEEPR